MRRAALLLAALMLTGCWTVRDHAWWQVHDPVRPPPTANAQMMILEIDDRGIVHRPEQKSRLHGWLEADSPEDPILVFVHGWHHNAWYASDEESRMDGHLAAFRRFVSEVEREAGGAPVDAIYVGWRGDSMDTVIPWESSDFLTFRGRKRASEEVGKKGLSDLFDYLRTRHAHRRIVIVGHSFGGAAVLHALRTWIDQGQEIPDNTEYVLLNPAAHYVELEPVERAMAARQRRLQAAGLGPNMRLERRHRKMVVFQSTGDFPVRWLYPLAAGSRAIGFDRKRVTHVGRHYREGPPGDCSSVLAPGFALEPAPGKTCDVDCVPVWIVPVDREFSRNHNDILNPVQTGILVRWIGAELGLVALDAQWAGPGHCTNPAIRQPGGPQAGFH